MKLSLVIPTYNEKENIQKLIKKIQKEFNIFSIKCFPNQEKISIVKIKIKSENAKGLSFKN